MYDSEFRAMVAAEERHWWYRGRRRVVDAALDGLGLPAFADILDVGCGSGRMLDELARRGRVTGVDIRPEAVQEARARGHARAIVAPAEDTGLPSRGYDLVTAFDVVEHTPDDRRTLSELLRVTRRGGVLLVTVPAYPRLWSHHDVVNQHHRRYTSGTLARAAQAAGWEVERSTYFFSHLLVPAALLRLAQRDRGDGDPRSDLEHAGRARLLGRLLEVPSAAEAAVVRRGGRLPAGLSLLAVLRAPAPALSAVPPAMDWPAHGDGRTRRPHPLPTHSSAVRRPRDSTPATRARHR